MMYEMKVANNDETLWTADDDEEKGLMKQKGCSRVYLLRLKDEVAFFGLENFRRRTLFIR